jgi:N-dimethylarginine dimethylaminohydrolase
MEPLYFEELEHGEELTLEQLGLMIGKGFAHNDKRFDALETRLGTIETLLLAEQKRKLEHLEARVKRLEDALAA